MHSWLECKILIRGRDIALTRHRQGDGSDEDVFTWLGRAGADGGGGCAGGVRHGWQSGAQLQLDQHSFGSRQTFHWAVRKTDSFPAELQLPVEVIVGTVRVVMDQTETAYARFDGKVRGIGKGGVTPAAGHLILIFRVLGIMKQQIRTPAEIHVLISVQPAWVLETQFVICEIDEGLALLDEFVAVPAIGVTERNRADLKSVQAAIAGFPVRTFTAEFEVGLQKLEVHREERGFHLLGEAAFQEALSMWTAAQRD